MSIVNYEGDRTKEGVLEGRGSATLDNGDYYAGQWKNNLKSGAWCMWCGV